MSPVDFFFESFFFILIAHLFPSLQSYGQPSKRLERIMGVALAPEEVTGAPMPSGGLGNGAQVQQQHPGIPY